MQGMRISSLVIAFFLWFILAVFLCFLSLVFFIYMISSGMNDGGVYTENDFFKIPHAYRS